LETRIKRGFPHSHSGGDGGLAGSYKTQHRIKSGPLTESFLHRTECLLRLA
jgi:hypothetical protein